MKETLMIIVIIGKIYSEFMKQKILLNKVRSKLSNNTNTNIKSTIFSDSRLLPISDIETKLDEYKQYLEEKKRSNKYRLSFTINPICSNVLFNTLSEIVYKEGSDECVYFGNDGYIGDNNIFYDNKFVNYFIYKGFINGRNQSIAPSMLSRSKMIQDTSYSHRELGNVVYHCGYDIFNNHILRCKEFSIINKISKNTAINFADKRKWFNTAYDYKRYFDGDLVDEHIDDLSTGSIETGTTIIHNYRSDELYTFEESINENLIEKDGWIGFTNKNMMEIPNYVSGDTINITLNKCLNNRNACEFIDMYPDRTLYSFTPKINEYRNNRVEKNWDYCLTYPYRNYYDNDLVQFKCDDFIINGIECYIVDDIFNEENDFNSTLDDYDDGHILTLKTILRNNFEKNSAVDIVLIGNINGELTNIRIPFFEKIISTGLNGKEKEYYFKIYGDQLIENLNKFDGNLFTDVQIRVRKVTNGAVCKYYFREFKRIQNLKNNGDINFNSSINSLGFSKNIYSDTVTQILYNDDIDITGIKDNLGRNVSEIFLTIVKNNEGNEKWYDEKVYTDESIKFSHCFGKITSGVDIKDPYITDFNIHKLHNIPVEIYGEYKSVFNDGTNDEQGIFDNLFNVYEDGDEIVVYPPLTLEDDIKINGTYSDELSGYTNTFLGDIVEFSPYALEEVTLEDVYHRFNTRQREYYKGPDDIEFFDLKKDEIYYDDYDIEENSEFMSYEDKMGEPYYYNAFYAPQNGEFKMIDGTHIPVNICPEGYYYKPHYKIALKEYKTRVEQGKHTMVVINGDIDRNGDEFSFTTSKNYYLEIMKELYLFHRITNVKKVAKIIDVNGKHFNKIKINVNLLDNEDLKDYIIFKPNSEMPETAYDLNDGSGRYLWREEKDDNEYEINSNIANHTFTNGAHYFNENIIFFLRRQDPSGEFGLSNENAKNPLLQNLTIIGNDVDYSNEEYVKEEEGNVC